MCHHRNECRDAILNAVVSISHVLKMAMLAHGVGRLDRVIPILKEADHFLWKIERALERCKEN